MLPEAMTKFKPSARVRHRHSRLTAKHLASVSLCPQIPDGLSADELRKSLDAGVRRVADDGLYAVASGMRSPMGETSRSECVAGMDMLNDMFQRQARRLESQLYQRAQDQNTIEFAQRQAQMAMAKVQQLEQEHREYMARMLQGSKCLSTLRQQMRVAQEEHELALATCEELERDVRQLHELLTAEKPEVAERIRLNCKNCLSVAQLRQKAAVREQALKESERCVLEHVGVTPTTQSAMCGGGSETEQSNPLHDLSLVADYASKTNLSQAMMGSPLSSAQTLSHDRPHEQVDTMDAVRLWASRRT
ncbi:MAG: hypothetical protein SGPRY_013499 [Prymnesium sp.]